jgi:hypothetical protein
MRSTSPATHEEHDEVYRLIMAGWGSQVVRTLATLSVAEHLGRSSLTAQQIAERAASDPDMTYRLLRAGTALGLLEYDPDTATFTGTSRLEILHPESPFTLKHYAQIAPSRAFWLPALRLSETVGRGHNYVEEMLGGSLWDFFADHDDEARMFRAAMTDVSAPVVREAVSVIGEAGEGFVLDVGGANGAFVGELLQRNPHLTGGVLDLPQAMAGVAEAARCLGLSDRMIGIAGDFFDSVPAADFYLLKFILHDWTDDSCTKILSNIRRSMKPGARLFIVEMVIADHGSTVGAALMDMGMLFGFPGREREISEFETLLHAADLEIISTTSLHPPYQLIEVHVCSQP